jgi:hypothetical protein
MFKLRTTTLKKLASDKASSTNKQRTLTLHTDARRFVASYKTAFSTELAANKQRTLTLHTDARRFISSYRTKLKKKEIRSFAGARQLHGLSDQAGCWLFRSVLISRRGCQLTQTAKERRD